MSRARDTRPALIFALLLPATVTAAGCLGPSDLNEAIERSTQSQLEALARSVAGPWLGVSVGLNLSFNLQEIGNAVSGSGTISENGVTSASTYTVSGTYQRPRLSLTFTGMVYQGRTVQGTFEGNYDSVGGVAARLQLSGMNFSREIDLLLHEPL